MAVSQEYGTRRTGVRAAAVPGRPARASSGAAATLAPAELDPVQHGLALTAPHLSALAPVVRWQKFALVTVAVGLALACLTGPGGAGSSVLAVIFALPFLAVVTLRLAALWHLARAKADVTPAGALAHCAADAATDAALPAYSVIVAVFREEAVAPALVAAMARLDYPADKVEVLFVTEEADRATRAALLSAGLTPNMRVLTAPEGRPRTKPRALNFALSHAQGELVAVYDAEDIPEPQQLRKAAARFAASDARTACLQAHLTIYNSEQSLATRQFALEYAALFGGVLPALTALSLPLPLGGTSNHFRRDVLQRVGAWDAFNVTEDADLGYRLARFGYASAVLASHTAEEAPATAKAWFGQRVRWLKGWMQTYLVHMRNPARLWAELGPWRFFGFQITLGGMVLSALVHPWMYILAAVHWLQTGYILPEPPVLWALCAFNLIAGYAAAGALSILASRQRGLSHALRSAALLPLYWLAISAAAYAALVEFVRRPYHWRKTAHSARAVGAKPV